MPRLEVRKAGEVPLPSRSPKAVREQQVMYEGFIRQIGEDVGQLELATGETSRGVKVRLRRAASRTGTSLDIWDVDGKVYFRAQAAKSGRRGRPRKIE